MANSKMVFSGEKDFFQFRRWTKETSEFIAAKIFKFSIEQELSDRKRQIAPVEVSGHGVFIFGKIDPSILPRSDMEPNSWSMEKKKTRVSQDRGPELRGIYYQPPEQS
jgi:hypothetical protein